MKEFFRELLDLIVRPFSILTTLLISIELTIIDPFGTFGQAPMVQSALSWLAVTAVAILLAYVVRLLVTRHVSNLGFWQDGLVVVVVYTLVCSPVVWGLAHVSIKEQASIASFTTIALSILLISAVVVQLRPHQIAVNEMKRPRLLARLSHKDISAIKHLTVRDHYVDVLTDQGKESLLMRFSDAMSELDGIDGLQVHRSHWVATNSVISVELAGAGGSLTLDTGDRIPVSRGFRQDVVARFSQAGASE
jgi:hypothetical protein